MINQFKSTKSLLLTPMFATLMACGGGGDGGGNNDGGDGPTTPTNSTGSIAISGTVQVGQTLMASVSDSNGTSSNTISYQWLSGGNNISGATNLSYTPAVTDVGNILSVTASYTDDDGFSEQVTSANTTSVIAEASTNTVGSVAISGTAQVGQTLMASVSDSNGITTSTITFQWLANGNDISGATDSSYSPSADDIGAVLSVTANYTDDDGFSEQASSANTTAVIAQAPTNVVGTATLNGTAEVGQTLSVAVNDSNGTANSTFTYQWQSGTTNINGATASTFTVTGDQVGSEVRVQIGYTDDDNFQETIFSNASAAIPVVANTGDGNFPRGTLGDNDSVPTVNCDSTVTSTSDLENAVSRTMAAGTTLCLADGNYSGLELDFGGTGTEAEPIVVAAQNSGEAIIGGEVSVRMSGEYVTLQGLVFQDGTSASSDFLQTRNGSGEPCNHCRITEVAVIDLDDADADSGKWLNIYGQHNRIDHSWFSGKTNTGALLIINREVPDGGTVADVAINYTQIDHNYFGNRAPTDGKAYADNSDNDYEAIRLGTSDAHTADALSVVEYNYFERIDGEAEVISNKSGNNRISNNTIRDSYGSLTTRHGSSATIANNFIIGDGHPFAGGIRIIDDGHRVVNNYIEGTRYLSTRFHGGIVLHNSNGSTSNGYQDLTNVLVANNTIVDSVNSLNVNGGNQSDNPESVTFINNIIDNAIGPIITYADEGMPANSTFAGNYVEGLEFSDDDGLTSFVGFTLIDPELTKDSLNISRPDSTSGVNLTADASANLNGFDPVADDMDGQPRSVATTSGADEALTSTVTTGVITLGDVGPINYRPPVTDGAVGRVALINAGFDAGTTGWIFANTASITDVDGEYFARESSAKIEDLSSRISQSVSVSPNTNYTLTAFTKGPIQLGADVGGTETTTDSNNSNYRFSSVSFNSGTNTSIEIFSEMDDLVSNKVAIADGSFSDFNGSNEDNWSIFEGATIGQVQGSSNSASGADGSMKFKYNDVTEVGTPRVTQLLTDIQANTDYELSAYVLEKNKSPVTVTIGVYEGATTNVVASQVFDYAALKAADAPQGDDKFLQGKFLFNSASHTSLTLFIEYNANTIIADGGSAKNTEFRVDDVKLSFEGAPANTAQAFADDFRLVSHPEL